jgi:hypothetical protein
VTIDGRLPHGAEVEVRAGDQAARARVGWLGGPYHQLRLDAPLDVAYGTRIEVDGLPGAVLDPDARGHGPSNDLLVELTRLARAL